MKIKVRNGYTFFYKNVPYIEGSILEVAEEDIANQSWKVEIIEEVKKDTEVKTVEASATKNRMIKRKDTVKK